MPGALASWLWLALVTGVWAQHTDGSEGEWVDADDAEYQVIVYGELLVEQARKELVRDLRREGYTEQKSKDDRTIYRHAEPWKGEVIIYDDGWVRMRRQRPHMDSADVPWAEEGSPLAYASCVLTPLRCVKLGGWTVSGRKFHAQKQRTLKPMESEIQVYGDRVADLWVERTVLVLPERMEALWEEGTPLEGEAPLRTHAERRQALLDYWRTRTCTEWGDRVREAVEAFMRGVVQQSEHPFTAAELEAAKAGRTCDRPLPL